VKVEIELRLAAYRRAAIPPRTVPRAVEDGSPALVSTCLRAIESSGRSNCPVAIARRNSYRASASAAPESRVNVPLLAVQRQCGRGAEIDLPTFWPLRNRQKSCALVGIPKAEHTPKAGCAGVPATSAANVSRSPRVDRHDPDRCRVSCLHCSARRPRTTRALPAVVGCRAISRPMSRQRQPSDDREHRLRRRRPTVVVYTRHKLIINPASHYEGAARTSL